MKRADISFVIGSMRIGGAERAALHLMNALVKRGLKVELVLLHKSGDFLSKVDPQISIFNLNKRKASQSIGVFKRYLQTNDPKKIFVIQNHIQLMVLIAVKLISWKGKIILNEQSTYLKNLKGFKGFMQIQLSKLLFPRADRIVAVSKGVAEELTHEFPALKSKICVINNPIITDEFLAVKNHMVDHPFFNGENKVIISAGRLTESKNFDLLIRAFRKVKSSDHLKLIILGDGEENHHLKHLIKHLQLTNDVSLPGFVTDPCRYFSKAEIFVLSSDYEGLPGVIIEALACGCKVVSTDCENGPAEILMNEKYGWLSPVGNSSALAEKIQIALNSKVDKESLINRANDFHENKIVDEYMKLFSKL